MSKILVTGAAGFIGYFLSRRLAEAGHEVVGLDNLNEYYDVRLKQDRLKQLEGTKNFRFEKMDLTDREAVSGLFAREQFEIVLNMAAEPSRCTKNWSVCFRTPTLHGWIWTRPRSKARTPEFSVGLNGGKRTFSWAPKWSPKGSIFPA